MIYSHLQGKVRSSDYYNFTKMFFVLICSKKEKKKEKKRVYIVLPTLNKMLKKKTPG